MQELLLGVLYAWDLCVRPFRWPCTLLKRLVSHACLQLVPEPCDASKSANIVFDASFSRDSSGRPLSQYSWMQVGSNDVVLAAAISAANAMPGGSVR